VTNRVAEPFFVLGIQLRKYSPRRTPLDTLGVNSEHEEGRKRINAECAETAKEAREEEIIMKPGKQE
jgi:hypothetical protein